MLRAPQIHPGHVGSNHGQAFHFVVGLPGFFATVLHPVIRLSEHDSPGRPNWDSGPGESCESLANVYRLTGAMLSEGHTHQWEKGFSCCPVLSQHNSKTRRESQTCLIRPGRWRSFQGNDFSKTDIVPAV
jgi:hypothetical protein